MHGMRQCLQLMCRQECAAKFAVAWIGLVLQILEVSMAWQRPEENRAEQAHGAMHAGSASA